MKRYLLAVLTMALMFVYGIAMGATFTYTGAEQQYVVPRGVSSVKVYIVGAQGNGPMLDNICWGGEGGTVTIKELSVTPGETIYINVGGYTGWPNGGTANGKYQGGGSSDVRQGGNAISDIVALAGGGGGGDNGISNGNHAGYGGDYSHMRTLMDGAPSLGYLGGKGGQETTGGAGAVGRISNGSDGSFFQGGAAGAGLATDLLGGNGGGGYYGGGGAGNYGSGAPPNTNGAGGGGGDSYVKEGIDASYSSYGPGWMSPRNGFVTIGSPWRDGQSAPLY